MKMMCGAPLPELRELSEPPEPPRKEASAPSMSSILFIRWRGAREQKGYYRQASLRSSTRGVAPLSAPHGPCADENDLREI